eukprot:7628276-Heterocapsa_arctica.AAC.1
MEKILCVLGSQALRSLARGAHLREQWEKRATPKWWLIGDVGQIQNNKTKQRGGGPATEPRGEDAR